MWIIKYLQETSMHAQRCAQTILHCIDIWLLNLAGLKLLYGIGGHSPDYIDQKVVWLKLLMLTCNTLVQLYMTPTHAQIQSPAFSKQVN